MRIVKSIPHTTYKITLFEMNHRLSLKIENGEQEQWFKFRPGTLTPGQIQERISDEFTDRVTQAFDQMQENQSLSFSIATSAEDEFDEII